MTRDDLALVEALADRARFGDEEALAVLRDLLLERVPAASRAFDEAHALADRLGREEAVWFFPTWLNTTTLRHRTTHLAFEIHGGNLEPADLFLSAGGTAGRFDRETIRRALVLYRASPRRGGRR